MAIEKEYEQILREEARYPKGAVVLSEEDRLFYLSRLENIQKRLIDILNRLPISVEYNSGSRFKKVVIERKLNQIEDTIRILNRKKVFVSSN